MVKVVDKTKREIQEEEKFSRLVELAKKQMPKYYISALAPLHVFSIHAEKNDTRGVIMVSQNFNVVDVYNPSYLEKAIQLAALYESSGLAGKNEGFTVKKNYRE